jgi:hypothetical protein
MRAETSASGLQHEVLGAWEGSGQPVPMTGLNRYNGGLFGPLAATATGASNDSLACVLYKKQTDLRSFA